METDQILFIWMLVTFVSITFLIAYQFDLTNTINKLEKQINKEK